MPASEKFDFPGLKDPDAGEDGVSDSPRSWHLDPGALGRCEAGLPSPADAILAPLPINAVGALPAARDPLAMFRLWPFCLHPTTRHLSGSGMAGPGPPLGFLERGFGRRRGHPGCLVALWFATRPGHATPACWLPLFWLSFQNPAPVVSRVEAPGAQVRSSGASRSHIPFGGGDGDSTYEPPSLSCTGPGAGDRGDDGTPLFSAELPAAPNCQGITLQARVFTIRYRPVSEGALLVVNSWVRVVPTKCPNRFAFLASKMNRTVWPGLPKPWPPGICHREPSKSP